MGTPLDKSRPVDPTDDLKAELIQTRRKLAQLTDEVARNTRILKASQQRELDLLQAEDLATLFRRLLFGLAKSYQLAKVTVVLCDPDHDVRHLLIAAGTQVETGDLLLRLEG